MSPLVLAALCACAPPQDSPLTLEHALALARERAPELIAARGRLDAAAGALDEASVAFAEDPTLETEVGRRERDDGEATDWSIAVSQRFEPWGARDARVGRAQAELLGARAGRDEAERLLLAEVATTFDRLLLADARIALRQQVLAVADDIRRAAEAQLQAGSGGPLDVNLARAAAGRATADAARAGALRGELAALLRAELGLPPDSPVTVQGELLAPWPSSLDELLATARARPDLAALQAELSGAESELGLAESQRRPGFGLRLGVGQDDHDEITALGLDIGLPIWGRGRGARTAAAARLSALSAQLASRRAAVESEVRAAFEAHALLLAAAQDFERTALPGLDENDELARRSWEAGAMDLLELLAVRRELLETRDAWLELQFDAAAARVRLQAAAGVLP